MRRTHGLELRIRVGLNAGEVVVRTISNDLHMDYSAVGQTTHLAARMEQLATPGSIRLTAATLRLVEGLVRVNALGPVPVKGLAEPVEVFELSGPVLSAGACRPRWRGPDPFCGATDGDRGAPAGPGRAETGHGQVVASSARPGWASRAWCTNASTPTAPRAGGCWRAPRCPTARPRPISRCIDLLKRYVHIDDGDDPRTIRAKVTGQVLTLDETLQETLPALLALLDALPEDSPFLHARSAAAAPAHARGAQARAAARKPGATPAAGL